MLGMFDVEGEVKEIFENGIVTLLPLLVMFKCVDGLQRSRLTLLYPNLEVAAS